jgi:hypothetical protein
VSHFELGKDWPIAFLISHFSILISQVMEGIVLILGVALDRAEEKRMIPSIT